MLQKCMRNITHIQTHHGQQNPRVNFFHHVEPRLLKFNTFSNLYRLTTVITVEDGNSVHSFGVLDIFHFSFPCTYIFLLSAFMISPCDHFISISLSGHYYLTKSCHRHWIFITLCSLHYFLFALLHWCSVRDPEIYYHKTL